MPERSGAKTDIAVVEHVMKAKGHDPSDALLRKRIAWSVKDWRKRMNRADV
jgi:hypothetical protein